LSDDLPGQSATGIPVIVGLSHVSRFTFLVQRKG
jgi:hypothetical protein